MKKELLSAGFASVSFFLLLSIGGCQSTKGNVGQLQSYAFYAVEPEWIRNGEPIVFEGEEWYPSDGIENLLDAEVYSLGEYRGVLFFVEKTDIRPYARLYTKFDKNKFRYFKKRANK